MDIKVSENQLFFSQKLMNWHHTINKREMPWKGEKNPYKIWLSEIILQQTRVEQGRSYYEKFIVNYPTIVDLAAANDDDAFKLWEGLGYYSRCKNLLFTARTIAEKHGGVFPQSHAEILALKGIGPYTAAAISSFAYNLPHAVLDGNVYRVLARFFGIHVPSDSTEGKKLFTALADACLDKNAPAAYNQAIMDFGATVCMPANPLCNDCPVQDKCVALQTGMISQLPVKTKQLVKRSRWFTYFIIEYDKKHLVRKRDGKDIWQNLHEFYLEESTVQSNWTDGSIKMFMENSLNIKTEVVHRSATFTQQLTHQTIFAQFILVQSLSAFDAPADYFWQPIDAINKLAFPKTITQYFNLSLFQTTMF